MCSHSFSFLSYSVYFKGSATTDIYPVRHTLSLHDAPPICFAALASTVATQGPGVLVTYAGFVSGFYLSLGALWLVLFLAALAIIGTRALDRKSTRLNSSH